METKHIDNSNMIPINAMELGYYSNGIDVIVTDHHKPEEKIPDCIAAVNPNRKDCEYPFKGLCGAGVAFKLAMAISDSVLPLLKTYPDIPIIKYRSCF